jgi:glycosyltransferase involved in cell wall biosynthesis
MNGLVSVIIPNFNHERYLAERIDSVLAQQYERFELILLDDHSTDGSREILERYRGNPRVREICYNDRNSGSPFSQWKKGIEKACGDYIWIAESDDAARPDLLPELVAALEEDPGNVIAFCESTSDRQVFYGPECKDGGSRKTWRGEDFLRSDMLTTPAIKNASAVVFRKTAVSGSVLVEILNYVYAGDWLFWSSLLMRGNVVRSGRALNFFRRHDESVARKADKGGLFVREGFFVMGYLKNELKVSLPAHVVRVWGSVWAQYYIRLRREQPDIFRINNRSSRHISPWLQFWFFYYFIRFNYFSALNIPK